jgi:quercetin dioxygenase-like cupin family protein
MSDFTITNLAELDDVAPKFGLGDVQEARFATKPLEAEQTGLSYVRMKPDQQPPFAHRHEEQEEVYLVLRGSGRVLLDGEAHDVKALDAIRVDASVVRAFESGPDGLDVVAFGAPAVSGGTNDAVMLDSHGEPMKR